MFARFGRLRLRQIHAHHRRGFGESVAFKNPLFESLFERLRKIEWKLFRASDNEPQTAKLIRLGFAQIAAQKGGSREEQGEFVLLDQSRVLCDFERIRISDNANAFDQRIP